MMIAYRAIAHGRQGGLTMDKTKKQMLIMLVVCWAFANVQVLAHGATPMGAVVFCAIESALCSLALYGILRK